MNEIKPDKNMERRARGWLVVVLLLLLVYGALVFYYGARQHLQMPRAQDPDQAHLTLSGPMPG